MHFIEKSLPELVIEHPRQDLKPYISLDFKTDIFWVFSQYRK